MSPQNLPQNTDVKRSTSGLNGQESVILDDSNRPLSSKASEIYDEYKKTVDAKESTQLELEKMRMKDEGARFIIHAALGEGSVDRNNPVHTAIMNAHDEVFNDLVAVADKNRDAEARRQLAAVDGALHYTFNDVAYVTEAAEEARRAGVEINLDSNHPANQYIQVPNPTNAPIV